MIKLILQTTLKTYHSAATALAAPRHTRSPRQHLSSRAASPINAAVPKTTTNPMEYARTRKVKTRGWPPVFSSPPYPRSQERVWHTRPLFPPVGTSAARSDVTSTSSAESATVKNSAYAELQGASQPVT